MVQTITPMIHVPDIRSTVQWYESIGFVTAGLNEEENGEVNWARLSFGNSSIMLNEGGRPSTEDRREVDLYLQIENIEEHFESLKDRVEVREGLHDTFYGMREFIIRDCNGFWITFGEPLAT